MPLIIFSAPPLTKLRPLFLSLLLSSSPLPSLSLSLSAAGASSVAPSLASAAASASTAGTVGTGGSSLQVATEAMRGEQAELELKEGEHQFTHAERTLTATQVFFFAKKKSEFISPKKSDFSFLKVSKTVFSPPLFARPAFCDLASVHIFDHHHAQNKCDICIAQSLDLFERKEKARSLEIKQAGEILCRVCWVLYLCLYLSFSLSLFSFSLFLSVPVSLSPSACFFSLSCQKQCGQFEYRPSYYLCLFT
jgi:hypothetical protein